MSLLDKRLFLIAHNSLDWQVYLSFTTPNFLFRISSGEEESRKRDYGVSPITPRSAAQLRLRFLSRVGQQVGERLAEKRICFVVLGTFSDASFH